MKTLPQRFTSLRRIPCGIAIVTCFSLAFVSQVSRAQTVTYQAGTDWKAINFDPIQTKPGTALDFSPFLDGPAGKYGAVIAQDGVFKFSGAPTVPARFYGVNLSAEVNFMPGDDSDWKAHMQLMAENIASAGYNAVRIHHHDWYLAPTVGSTTLSTEKFKRLRFLLSCLKKRGIYYTIELYSGRSFPNSLVTGMTDAPGEPADGKFQREALPLMLISDPLLNNIATFAVNLLTTLGTDSDDGTTYASTERLGDDPALISIEFINEDSWFASTEKYPDTVQPLVDAAFIAAWDPAQHGGQPVPTKPSAAWDLEKSKWLVERSEHRYQYLKNRLNTVGICKPFMDMSFRTNLIGALNRKSFDYVDVHTYWAMPDYGPSGQNPPYEQIVADPFTPSSTGKLKTLFDTAGSRLFGKPMVVGEFDILSPNPRRVFMGPVMAAVGGMQNWSAMYRYAYGHKAEQVLSEQKTERLETATEPAEMLSERIAAMLFRLGEVVKSDDSMRIPYVVTPDYLKSVVTLAGGPKLPSIYWELGSFVQIGLVVYDPASPPDLSGYPCVVVPASMTLPTGFPTAKSVKDNSSMFTGIGTKVPTLALNRTQPVNSTGQILTDFTQNVSTATAPVYKVVTPRTETFAFSGAGPAMGGTGSVVTMSNVTAAGVCFVGSLDGIELSKSKSQLVLFLTETQNSGSVITTSGGVATLETLGDIPHLARQGSATFTIKAPGTSLVPEVWVLNYDGTRRSQIVPAKTTDGYSFTASAVTDADAYFAYEINWPFTQDFGSSTTLSSYVHATTPNRGQFHDLSAEANVSWSIEGGTLKLNHPGNSSTTNNGAGFTRLGGAVGVNDVAEVRFKLSVNDLINTSTDLVVLDLGYIDQVLNYNTATPNSNMTNRLTIGGSTGNFRVRMNGLSSPNYLAGTTVPVAWILNQSGATASYTGADSLTYTVASGTSDMWVNGVLVFNDAPRSAAFLSTEMGGFRFRAPAPGSNQSSRWHLKIDDFTVYDSLR